MLARYNRRRELVIDPILGYATLLGGNQDDHALAIAVDGSGLLTSGVILCRVIFL
jgi:hypothetical protein